MAWWSALAPDSKKDMGLIPSWAGPFCVELKMFSLCLRGFLLGNRHCLPLSRRECYAYLQSLLTEALDKKELAPGCCAPAARRSLGMG